MNTINHIHPLTCSDTTNLWADLNKLGEVLWNWHLCNACTPDTVCHFQYCPWHNRNALGFFQNYYESMTSDYHPQARKQIVLNSRDDLLAIVQHMKQHPTLTRTEVMRECFHTSDEQDPGPLVWRDRDRAVSMAASLIFCVDFGYEKAHADDNDPFKWEDGWKLSEIVGKLFPSQSGLTKPISKDAWSQVEIKEWFSAENLKKKIKGLSFEATDDLRNHLRFDQHARVLQVFQGTAVMKQILLASQTNADVCFIPRALAVECCSTIYNLLFDFDNGASYKILEGLVRKNGFYEDLKSYNSAFHQIDIENDDKFPYFGCRLNILLEEMQDPSPANWFERLFDSGEKSAERRMLMITMIGVAITAMSSTLNLIVASYQAYVGYQAWQSQTREQ
ncbi:hypothetical protein FB567DRAFT_444586 [Paraphoma chrysanthemicola]|uniref:Uncharacterized protein n=1 Tax=Paraphoma chrysanthemicola TaxID=798071 RepID=A0A8K0VXC5_9PLEO|nr:hypothetical protein FB567DRAFT_444586 [Paraphoma chrysanthemicola]